MELWIRTQDKKDLIKVDYISYEIAIEDKHILWYKSIDLGTYKTKERALQILDEIQNILQPTVIYHEPEINYDDMIQSLTENVVVKTTQKVDFELKQAGQIVYQMPKE